MSNGYGRDVEVAFLNSPDEARFKLLKVIYTQGRYFVAEWTTTGKMNLIGKSAHENRDDAIAVFNERLAKIKSNDPNFDQVYTRTIQKD